MVPYPTLVTRTNTWPKPGIGEGNNTHTHTHIEISLVTTDTHACYAWLWLVRRGGSEKDKDNIFFSARTVVQIFLHSFTSKLSLLPLATTVAGRACKLLFTSTSPADRCKYINLPTSGCLLSHVNRTSKQIPTTPIKHVLYLSAAAAAAGLLSFNHQL